MNAIGNQELPSWLPASGWVGQRFVRRVVSHRDDPSSTASLVHSWGDKQWQNFLNNVWIKMPNPIILIKLLKITKIVKQSWINQLISFWNRRLTPHHHSFWVSPSCSPVAVFHTVRHMSFHSMVYHLIHTQTRGRK